MTNVFRYRGEIPSIANGIFSLLATVFATSRPTVSQAIRILVVRGLVESRRGSGAYVTRRPEAELTTTVSLMLDLNQESVQHLSELRLQLETTGIEWAIERATADQVDAGKAALEQMRDSAGYAAAWMSVCVPATASAPPP